MQRFWTADRTASSAPLSEPSTRIIGSEKGAADVMVETQDATNPDNEIAIVHQEEEQFEWREILRGKYLISRARIFEWCMLSVSSRPDRYSGMVHRSSVYGLDREPVLLFFVFVSKPSFFAAFLTWFQGPLLSPNLGLKEDKLNCTQVC